MMKTILAALLSVSGVTAVSGGFLAAGSTPAQAKDAHVVRAKATRTAAGTWRFDVTVKSADTGWKKYADRWQVLGPDGKVLGTRILYHPHVDEQPFTRSLGGVRIPKGVTKVTIRARDKVSGYGGKSVTLILKPGS